MLVKNMNNGNGNIYKRIGSINVQKWRNCCVSFSIKIAIKL